MNQITRECSDPRSIESLIYDIRLLGEERGFILQNIQATLDENESTQRTITMSFQLTSNLSIGLDRAKEPAKKEPIKRSRFDLIKD